MRKSFNKILSLAFLFVYTYSDGASAACFTPLSDPNSNNVADWQELIDHKGDKGAEKEINFIQELDNDNHSHGSKISLDYFAVTINKHPTKSIEEFFLELRQNLNSIIFNSLKDGQFNSYEFQIAVGKPSFIPDEKKTKRNLDKWNSKSPKGALMNFALEVATLVVNKNGIALVLEEGDVLVTCSTERDFIFSTVSTSTHGWHPVSGNRGFGIKENLDGSWTFYTMAADRLSNHAIVKYIEKDNIFEYGRKVWVEMVSNFSRRYNALQPRNKVDTNSNLYPFP